MVRPVTEDDTGLKVLYNPPEGTPTDCDILAIHGIGAHPDDTWCKKIDSDNGEPQYVNWLSHPQMLPSAVPNARVMRYGYMSRWFGNEAIRQNATTVADRLLRALKRDRRTSDKERPLLFVAHCFGGLVVLKAVLKAALYPNDWPGIYNTVLGIVFFGTPFRGAEQVSQAEMIRAAQSQYRDDVHSEILHITHPDDELLLALVHDFEKMRTESKYGPELACFFEQMPCDVMAIVGQQGKKSFRVSESSGCLDAAQKIGLQRTHFNMNKFGKPNEEEYLEVQEVVMEMVEAPKLRAARSRFGSGKEPNGSDESAPGSLFRGRGIQHSGAGNLSVGGDVNIS